MKRFYVVLNSEGNQRQMMKQWLRDHPEELPEDCDYPTSRKTSHQLRDALKKKGWTVQETPSEVLLTPPGVTLQVPLTENEGMKTKTCRKRNSHLSTSCGIFLHRILR